MVLDRAPSVRGHTAIRERSHKCIPWRRRRLRRLAQSHLKNRPSLTEGSLPQKRKADDINEEDALPLTKRRRTWEFDSTEKWDPSFDRCESSRKDSDLVLVGERAPDKAKWEYPLGDERWRCYAGYLPGALSPDVSKKFFDIVKDGTDWLQPSGRWGPLPLKTAWMTKPPCNCIYGYGGAKVPPAAYPDWMYDLMAVCMPLCGISRRDDWPNSANLNMYVDGQHSVGWHADNETLFQGKAQDCCIISLSMGQTRLFELKCGRIMHKLELADGDLCTMEGMTQKHFQHRVGKQNGKDIKTRLNITWRWVVLHDKQCSCSQAPESK
eukprot:TRINITY_DN13852_c0_g1_i1.p1 TRINITY_DN13852_c0_g1~~TRINITY_DN13852_c0_g1_i1.p1  ORF type:complete len:324 (-),score=41.41 TRINITY_DN13852_c0_g1_i1:169-1140(-)